MLRRLLLVFRTLVIVVLVFISSCGGVDTSFFSVTNIPPPPPGKAQIILFGNHQHRMIGRAYLDRNEMREFSGSILNQFTTEPGRHDVMIGFGGAELELSSGTLDLQSGQTAYLAIMHRKIYERDWSHRPVKMLDSVSSGPIPDFGVVLLQMNRAQADEYWHLKKLW